MRILGIDPGTRESGVVLWDSETVLYRRVQDNYSLRDDLRNGFPVGADVVVMESMTPYATGYTTMATLLFLGRLFEICDETQRKWYQVTRQAVVKHITGRAHAKKPDTRNNDTRVRDALIARFPATGGGKVPQIGIKAQPGPLYGMATHMWPALAVAITWFELEGE